MRRWMPEAIRLYEQAPVKHANRKLPRIR